MSAYIGRGARDPGPWNQPGVLVVRPQSVAFIPTGPRTYVAAILSKAAVAGAGVLVVERNGRQMDQAQLRAYLAALAPDELDAEVSSIVQSTAGVIYAPGEALYDREELPLGVRLSFSTPDDRLLLADVKSVMRNPEFLAVVETWPAAPTRVKKPIAAVAAIVVGALLGLGGLLSLLATALVVLIELSSDQALTEGGAALMGLLCFMDGLLLVPASGLLYWGIQRFKARRDGVKRNCLPS